MSAADVIEQIKALPPKEKSRVVEFVRQCAAEFGGEASAERTVCFATPAQAKAAGDKVVEQYPETFRRLSQ